MLLTVFCNRTHAQQQNIKNLEDLLKQQTKGDTNRVKILNSLAYFYYQAKDQQKLKLFATQALKLSVKLNYLQGMACSYSSMSYLYTNDNADPKALEYLNKSYNIYKSLNQKLKCSNILSDIADYYSKIKDYNNAIVYDIQAMEAINELDQPSLKIFDLTNIGDDFEKNKQYKQAEVYYLKSYALVQKTGDRTLLPISLLNLASIDFKQKKYNSGLVYCDKVRLLLKEGDHLSDLDIAALNLLEAQFYYELKDYSKARKYLNISDSITNGANLLEIRIQVYHIRYMLDSATNNPYSALKYSYMYHHLNENITDVSKDRVSAVYNFNVKTQKTADENLRLRIIDEKNKDIISKQHSIEMILFLGLFIFLCVLIHLKRSINQIEIKNKIIKEQKNNLENSNSVKDKLFSVISHDLRSPIAQVIALINLWETGEVGNKELLSITPVIKSSITSTLQLLDTLLIWSTSHLTGSKFNASTFKLKYLIKRNIEELQDDIKRKQLVVNNKVPADIQLYADSAMLKIIFRNLISNAIKFTPAGGVITINSYSEDATVTVVVEDTGVGISEAGMDKVFSFSTHSTLGTDNERGTGIGLKICREFMELNNGKIWAESNYGEGSRFFVSFPAFA